MKKSAAGAVEHRFRLAIQGLSPHVKRLVQEGMTLHQDRASRPLRLVESNPDKPPRAPASIRARLQEKAGALATVAPVDARQVERDIDQWLWYRHRARMARVPLPRTRKPWPWPLFRAIRDAASATEARRILEAVLQPIERDPVALLTIARLIRRGREKRAWDTFTVFLEVLLR